MNSQDLNQAKQKKGSERMNEKIILTLIVIILASITPIHAVELDDDSLQELHELEDKMSMEMYGMSFDELKAKSTGAFVGVQVSIMYDQRINNVEQAVQNYLMIHGDVEKEGIDDV